MQKDVEFGLLHITLYIYYCNTYTRKQYKVTMDIHMYRIVDYVVYRSHLQIVTVLYYGSWAIMYKGLIYTIWYMIYIETVSLMQYMIWLINASWTELKTYNSSEVINQDRHAVFANSSLRHAVDSSQSHILPLSWVSCKLSIKQFD